MSRKHDRYRFDKHTPARSRQDIPEADRWAMELAGQMVAADIAASMRERDFTDNFTSKKAAIRAFESAARDLFYSKGGTHWTPAIWRMTRDEIEDCLSLTPWPRRRR